MKKVERLRRGEQRDNAVKSFLMMWANTDELIESELKSRGEKFVPGDNDFDALTSIIEENRQDRDEYERAMSETITGWSSSRS
ncbi:hypothetical protein ACQQ2Q_17905 [Agrobacterium sp. ES01]|uniref:hypothetical protein n=1 Tax=Agrobacterium sp. ES01 TaxID=3420714 RepID=UPI003D10DDA9